MAYVIRVHAYGGPEAMTWENVDVPAPGPGEAKIRHTHIGLNFIDVYHRNGLYKQPHLPFVLGTEGAGEVIAVGPGVTDVAVGDRVAYASVIGAYAEERLIPASRLVKLPAGIDSKTAAVRRASNTVAAMMPYRARRGTHRSRMRRPFACPSPARRLRWELSGFSAATRVPSATKR